MKVNCVLKCWYKKIGEKDDKFQKISTFEAHHYNTKAFVLKYELQIISINKDDDEIEILKTREIKMDNSTSYLSFHSVDYAYDSQKDIIYCVNTIQNI